MAKTEVVFGIHSVQALLKSAPHRITAIKLLRGRQDQRIQKIVNAAEANKISLKYVDRKSLDQACEGNHQGVIALASPGKTYDEKFLYDLISDLSDDPLILVLDGVTDPHNLGACLRTADAAGVHAVVIPKDNSASLSEVARKVASGAADSVPLIPVTNLARTLKKLQEAGVWVAGAAGEAENTVYETDLRGSRAIVIPRVLRRFN